jgi:hypothetical protein
MQQPPKKTTCETKGHSWSTTTSGLAYRCSRTGCHVVRVYLNGVWHETQPDQPKQLTPPVAQQTELWT